MDALLITKGNILEGNELHIEYRERKKPHFEQSIDKSMQVPEGWEIKKEYKKLIRIKKNKTIGNRWEDTIWRLFYEIGIKKLSSRDFSIFLREKDGNIKTKQIDIFGLDDDIAFVVECKSQETLGKKSLKKDIAEFVVNQDAYRKTFKSLFNNNKLQLVWIFATENIEWDDNDKIDAEENNILIWDEYALFSLQNLAGLAGEGAKYQIYNRIFFGKKIKNFEIQIPALKSKMGGRTYYCFTLNPEHLLKISYVHERSKEDSFLELSDSYQRMINKSRIRKVEEYIRGGGFFPGSLIVNFKRKFLKEEILGTKDLRTEHTTPVMITLPPYYGCAWIIDGQHRLYGYADTEEKRTETMPVVAFIDEPENLQAKIFVDINKNQKAIEADLLWDLYEDLYAESTEEKELQLYVISKIAKKLNSMKDSPFYGCITIPKEQNRGNISLTTVCGSIKQQGLIDQGERLLFCDSYEATIKYAADRIAYFFDVFRREMKVEWNAGDKHYIRSNAAFVVFMGILRDLIGANLESKEIRNLDVFKKQVEKFLEPLLLHLMEADDDTLRQYRSAGGSSQKSRLHRYEFSKLLRDAKIGFGSRWLDKYEEALEKENEEKIKRRKRGVEFYLEKDESEVLEFKATLKFNLDRYLRGDGKWVEDEKILDDGVMKTIVAFLNSKGGELIIGVLEKPRYEDLYEEKLLGCPVYKDKIIYGINNEYSKEDWDGYQQRLLSLIETRISPEVIDGDLLKIQKLPYEDRDLCLVTVEPSESKQYLGGKIFIRRVNTTEQLVGKDIDNYWLKKKKK